jgi:hypothetical protein
LAKAFRIVPLVVLALAGQDGPDAAKTAEDGAQARKYQDEGRDGRDL